MREGNVFAGVCLSVWGASHNALQHYLQCHGAGGTACPGPVPKIGPRVPLPSADRGAARAIYAYIAFTQEHFLGLIIFNTQCTSRADDNLTFSSVNEEDVILEAHDNVTRVSKETGCVQCIVQCKLRYQDLILVPNFNTAIITKIQ